MRHSSLLIVAATLLMTACKNDDPPEVPCLYDCVPAGDLAPGDADVGRAYVLEEGFMTCGIPTPIFEFGAALIETNEPLDGRTGNSADLPYDLTAGTSPRGVEVVNTNCLSCHASYLNGELVLGLGNVKREGGDDSEDAVDLGMMLADTDEEVVELEIAGDIAHVTDQYTLDTIGMNAGATTLMAVTAFRDPETLAWLEEPHMDLPPDVLPMDVPAWWHMRKKNAMFAHTAGRGDWAIMAMNAAAACAETPELAAYVLDMAPHVRAWVQSMKPPAWPRAVDQDLADDGRDVFEETCSECHGTYRDGEHVYPNVVVPLDVVGTDPEAGSVTETWQGAWDGFFSRNDFGANLDWAPQEGYIAPPLDGVWASAPYFHNGSVPTVAAVIDPSQRPDVWKRTSRDSTDYSYSKMGWNWEHVDEPRDSFPEEEQFDIYDTSRHGYSNDGHAFGAGLDKDQQAAVLEYLKTL